MGPPDRQTHEVPPERQLHPVEYQIPLLPSKRRAVQSDSFIPANTDTRPDDPPVRFTAVISEDTATLCEQQIWESPSFFEEAYEAILLARAAIDSFEEDLAAKEEGFWSNTEC